MCRTGWAVVWDSPDTASTNDPEVRAARPLSIDEMADDVDIFADIYMQPTYDDPIVEIGLSSLTPYYTINPLRENKVGFSTGRQDFLTLNLDWKWLRAGYSFPLVNAANGYNFTFSPCIGNFYVDLGISRIRNYKSVALNNYWWQNQDKDEDDQDETPAGVRLEGLETFEWRCNLEWILNKTYFSASSAFSQSYSSGQRVSAGSLLCGAAFGENRFKLNPSEKRSEEANEILANLPMTDNRIYNLSLGCGYGYNFVVRQGVFVVGVLLVPYFSIAHASYELSGEDVGRICFGMRSHGRVNCVYQNKYGFVTLSSQWVGLYFNDDYFSYFQNNPSINLSVALKLGELGIRHEKIPGHRVIDFLGKLF